MYPGTAIVEVYLHPHKELLKVRFSFIVFAIEVRGYLPWSDNWLGEKYMGFILNTHIFFKGEHHLNYEFQYVISMA